MYDPAGNFSRVHNWGEDRNAGIRILADRHDEEDDNFADAFNLAFLRTGIVPMTGPLNMGANPIRAIAAGSIAAPSVTWELSPLTGISQPNPDALAFGSNGVEKMRMTSEGMVIPVLVGAVSFTGTLTAANIASQGSVSGATLSIAGDGTIAGVLTAGHIGVIGTAHIVGTLAADAGITTAGNINVAGHAAVVGDVSMGSAHVVGQINDTVSVTNGVGIQITSPTNADGNIRYINTVGHWITGMLGAAGWDRWTVYNALTGHEAISVLQNGNVAIGATLSTTGSIISTSFIRSSDGGGGFAELRANGDVVAARAGGDTGVIFLNSANTRYIYNDGVNYIFTLGGINVAGGIVCGGNLQVNGAMSVATDFTAKSVSTTNGDIYALKPTSWPQFLLGNSGIGQWHLGPTPATVNNFAISLNAIEPWFVINTSGHVGMGAMGNTSPLAPLHVKANIQESMRLEGPTPRGTGQNYFTFHDPSGRKGFVGYGSAASDLMYVHNDLGGVDVRGWLGPATITGTTVEFTINGTPVGRFAGSGNMVVNYGLTIGTAADAGLPLYVRKDQAAADTLMRVDNALANAGTGAGVMATTGSSGAYFQDVVREIGDGTAYHLTGHGAAIVNHYNDCNQHTFRKTDGTTKFVMAGDGGVAQYGGAFTMIAPATAAIQMESAGAAIMRLHTLANIANIDALGARAIMFSTNGAYRAEILGSGKFMVTGTVQEQFDVSVGATQLIRSASGFASPLALKVDVTGVAGTLASFYNINGGNGQPRVGWIGTDGLSSTSYNTTSDGRLKENVQPCSDPGAIIDAVNIVSFDWKSGGSARFGTVAQDLFAIAPEGIHVGDNDNDEVSDPWGVDPSKYVFMLWREIQLLRERVAFLEGYGGQVTK